MANSDNVVRGGLTPKYKDKEILYQMLPYEELGKERKPLSGTKVAEGVKEYKSGFKEFRVF
jgi:mannose-6-phosphate isomerase class I